MPGPRVIGVQRCSTSDVRQAVAGTGLLLIGTPSAKSPRGTCGGGLIADAAFSTVMLSSSNARFQIGTNHGRQNFSAMKQQKHIITKTTTMMAIARSPSHESSNIAAVSVCGGVLPLCCRCLSLLPMCCRCAESTVLCRCNN